MGRYTGVTFVGGAAGASGSIEGWYNVKDYGAVGNGVANDSAAFTSALAAGTGKTVYVPPGTYLVVGVTLPAATTLWLMPGSTVKLPNSSGSHIFYASGVGARLLGPGTLDGNRANQSGNVMPLYITVANVTVDGITSTGSAYNGIHAQTCSHLKITNCYVTDCVQTGIFVDASAGVVTDVEVSFNRIDRSAENPTTGVGDAGIYLYADAAGGERITRGRVVGNDVIHPTDPVYAMCGIVTRGVDNSTFAANTTSAGQIGISIDSATTCSVGENTVFNASDLGIELALSTGCTISGNTVDGNALTDYGISVTNTGPISNSITGNTVKGCLLDALRVVLGNYTTISGNTFMHSVAGAAALISTSQHVSITGNTWYGAGTATRAIVLSGTDRCTISGNDFYNFTADAIRITFTTAVVVDLISVSGGTFDSCGTIYSTSLSGGATLGSRITFTGCVGIHATYTVDIVNLALNVLRASGAGTPESALVAGIGSTFQRNEGGAGTSFYVKQSGTGNTGWVGK